jgi:hypothetical protein
MRELFGRMLQVAAGGGGIDQISGLLRNASATYQDICRLDEVRFFGLAIHEVTDALQPEFPFYQGDNFASFSANKADIVAMALRVAAHERLRSGTPQINAERALHDAIRPMLKGR